MNVTTIGIDLAKNTFSVCGCNAHGKVLFRKSLHRDKLLAFIAQQPPCLIGMEACSGAHHWARLFQAQGHTIGMMAPKFVTPFRKGGGKNDGNDAVAIALAVSHPEMRFLAPGFLLKDKYDTLGVFSDFNGPVLVIHGKHDEVIPVTEGQQLATAAKHGQLIEYACGHTCWDFEQTGYWRDVPAFLFAAGVIGVN